MLELNLKESTIVTLDQEDTLKYEEGTVRVVPIWKYLLSNS
jgi:predicted AAA+ superfamily ATPase